MKIKSNSVSSEDYKIRAKQDLIPLVGLLKYVIRNGNYMDEKASSGVLSLFVYNNLIFGGVLIASCFGLERLLK